MAKPEELKHSRRHTAVTAAAAICRRGGMAQLRSGFGVARSAMRRLRCRPSRGRVPRHAGAPRPLPARAYAVILGTRSCLDQSASVRWPVRVTVRIPGAGSFVGRLRPPPPPAPPPHVGRRGEEEGRRGNEGWPGAGFPSMKMGGDAGGAGLFSLSSPRGGEGRGEVGVFVSLLGGETRSMSSPESGSNTSNRDTPSIRHGPAAGAARGHGETAGPDQGRGERVGIPR